MTENDSMFEDSSFTALVFFFKRPLRLLLFLLLVVSLLLYYYSYLSFLFLLEVFLEVALTNNKNQTNT